MSLLFAALPALTLGLRRDVALVDAGLADAEIASLRAAEATFRWIVFKGVSVDDEAPFQCEQGTYTFEATLGAGFEGVTVLLRQVGNGGQKVVAKLTKTPAKRDTGAGKTLQKECDIYKTLQAARVPHTLACEASCYHGHKGSKHLMVVLSPYVEGAKPWTGTWIGGTIFEEERRPFGPTSPRQVTGAESEPTHAGVERGLRLSFETAWAMLGARIANTDQHHNILYEQDGTPTFIDMGLAVDLSKKGTYVLDPDWYMEGFLKAIFDLIPPLMLDWAERELVETRPELPSDVEKVVRNFWPKWKLESGAQRADKETKRLQKEFEETCRFCPKIMCDYGSFKIKCAACPQCQM